MKKTTYIAMTACLGLLLPLQLSAQMGPKLPDTGQTEDYTIVFGEDSDYLINPPTYTDKADGTIMDEVTGLRWQKNDGGEMTWEAAVAYCDNLVLGERTNWRLPSPHEAFLILDHSKSNPALNTLYFPDRKAQYWWCSQERADDSSRAWATNAGGGIGPHPKGETQSAGGNSKFHARCVSGELTSREFTAHGSGLITDHRTGLTWQQNTPAEKMSWEEALRYCEELSLSDHSDWRLPNVKELQSLFDFTSVKPAIDPVFFPGTQQEPYWTSTTLFERDNTSKAWMLDFKFGIVSYQEKNELLYVRAVRNADMTSPTIQLAAQEAYLQVSSLGGEEYQFSFFMVEPGSATLRVFYLDGKLAAYIFQQDMSAGHHSVSWNNGRLSSGIYLVVFQAGKYRFSKKMIIQNL